MKINGSRLPTRTIPISMVKVMQFSSTMTPAMTMLINIGLVYGIWAGGLDTMKGGMTVGQLVAFINYLMTILNPLMQMSMVAIAWANGLASARRINEVLDAVPEVEEPTEGLTLPESTKPAWSSRTFLSITMAAQTARS